MRSLSETTAATYPLTLHDIKTYIQLQDFKPFVFVVTPTQEPRTLIVFFSALSIAPTPIRKQCLINYQDHWLGLDIERKIEGAPLSIIILDAANTLHKIACCISIINQICLTYDIEYNITHIASEHPLQRNSSDCSIFSWEHLRFAAQKEHFHSLLIALRNSEDNARHFTFAESRVRSFFKDSTPMRNIDRLIDSLQAVHWIDYSRLEENPEEWQEFFVNTQAVIKPTFLNEKIEEWLIEKLSSDKEKWTTHNVRILYCGHLIKASIERTQQLLPADFIINEICKSHQKSRSELGLVLRLAVSNGCVRQVKRLLEVTSIDVINEVPLPSQLTALDQAEKLSDPVVKEKIKTLLLAKGACFGPSRYRLFSGAALSTESDSKSVARLSSESGVISEPHL